MLFFGILLTILGIVFIISPTTSWWLSNWWRFEGDTEPSSFSLAFYRLGGVIYLIIGIVLIAREL